MDFSDYQDVVARRKIFDLPMESFVLITKLSIETLMEEIKPVVTENPTVWEWKN